MRRGINKVGLSLVKEFEGFQSKPYVDEAGVWTIGYGTISYPNGAKVTGKDKPCTIDEALEWLEWEINEKAETISDYLVKIGLLGLNDNQFSALVSIAYNVGIGIVIEPNRTMSRALRSKNITQISEAFLVYDRIVKKIGPIRYSKALRGLTRRRVAERDLFLKPCPSEVVV